MKQVFLLVILILTSGTFFCAGAADDSVAPQVQQRLLKKVFDSAVELDPALINQVRSMEPGRILYLPRNSQRRHAEAWFIDGELRNPTEFRPVLVRAIDEDDDLREGDLPDFDSDLYIADWHADGSADVAIDYQDNDHDQDVDEMGMYFVGSTHNYFGEPVLRVWWAQDTGDDNQLIYDVAYHYIQSLCQWRSHFSGNETILAFAITESGKEWIPFWENPFDFYDQDGDGASEEVLRLSGVDRDVEAYRHSFDADHDSSPHNIHDYDVSVTAWAPGARWTRKEATPGLSDLKMESKLTESVTLRGFPTRPFVRHDRARQFCAGVTWERAMLTWDENDNNIDQDKRESQNERWEGIIAKGNSDFMQVGGPSTGQFNKRYELSMKPSGPVRLYYLPTDQRLHLRGADRGWVDVDQNYDDKPDYRYELSDSDHDGEIDTWTFDADLDGKPDDRWTRDAKSISVAYEFTPIHEVQSKVLRDTLPAVWALNQALRQRAVEHGLESFADAAWAELRGQYDPELAGAQIAAKLAGSEESLRFQLDINKDRLIARLKAAVPDANWWPAFNAARSRGDLAGMVQAIRAKRPTDDWLDQARAEMNYFRRELQPEDHSTHVGYDDHWLPPNVAWESELAAYRTYYGQFDFFGKSKPGLILDKLESTNTYHAETDWGMDALLVGNSPGCGGLTLYINGKPYPAWSNKGEGAQTYRHTLLRKDADSLIARIEIGNVGPAPNPYTLTVDCHATAGRADTLIQVRVSGGNLGDRLQLGIGLTRLHQEQVLEDRPAGVLGIWGAQSMGIGYIGMGLVIPAMRDLQFKTMDHEHQAMLPVKNGQPVEYRIQCAWQRGMQVARCPGAPEWFAELRQTAADANGTADE